MTLRQPFSSSGSWSSYRVGQPRKALHCNDNVKKTEITRKGAWKRGKKSCSPIKALGRLGAHIVHDAVINSPQFQVDYWESMCGLSVKLNLLLITARKMVVHCLWGRTTHERRRRQLETCKNVSGWLPARTCVTIWWVIYSGLYCQPRTRGWSAWRKRASQYLNFSRTMMTLLDNMLIPV